MSAHYRKGLALSLPKGFTLIELLVVISIIGILSVIGLTRYSSAQENARKSATLATLDAIYKQIEWRRMSEGKLLGGATGLTVGSYCTHCSCYVNPSGCTVAGQPACALTHDSLQASGCQARLYKTYITGLGMASIPLDGWGDPILLDENEGEYPSNLCRHDNIWSINAGSKQLPFSSLLNCQ